MGSQRAGHAWPRTHARTLWLRHEGSVAAALGFQSTGSVVVAHRFSCSRARDLPGSGIEPVSLASQGRFLTTGPPQKSHYSCFMKKQRSKELRFEPRLFGSSLCFQLLHYFASWQPQSLLYLFIISHSSHMFQLLWQNQPSQTYQLEAISYYFLGTWVRNSGRA